MNIFIFNKIFNMIPKFPLMCCVQNCLGLCIVSYAYFSTGVCLSVTLYIFDLLQYYVCFITSGVTHVHPVYGTQRVPYLLVQVGRTLV